MEMEHGRLLQEEGWADGCHLLACASVFTAYSIDLDTPPGRQLAQKRTALL